MVKLYFENSYGNRYLIGEPKSYEESWHMVYNYCAERNFAIPYVRTWATQDGENYYDVGSHTEFFVEVEE